MSDRQSLPGRIIDKIRDGVPTAELRSSGNVAIYRALVSSAASAQQRGWREAEWSALVDEPASELGRQNRLGSSPRDAAKRLDKAWTRAAEWLREEAEAPRTPSGARAEARATASLLRDLAADPDSDLVDRERRLLAHLAQVAADRGSDRITLGRDAIRSALQMGSTTFAAAVAGLEAHGLVVVVQAGSRRARGAKNRATVYKLPTPNPEKRFNSPPKTPDPVNSPPPSSPSPVNSPPPEEAMPDQITMTTDRIIQLLGEEALRTLLATQIAGQDADLPDNVVALPATGTGGRR